MTEKKLCVGYSRVILPFFVTSLGVFLLSFALSFMTGSLVFVPYPGMADEGSTSSITVSIESNISIATNASGGIVSIPIIPSPSGAQSSAFLSVDVSTNNATGYSLLMSSNSEDTMLAHAHNTIAGYDNNIPSIATNTANTVLPSNTWGYSISHTPTAYSVIPPYSAPAQLRKTDAASNASVTDLTFSANANSELAAGTYAGIMLFTAIANESLRPVDPGTTHGALQDITLATCPTTRGTAFDARSGQVVFIRKIPNTTGDGLGDMCWMETNLRYGGDGEWDPGWGWDDDRYATSTTNDTASLDDDARGLIFINNLSDGGSLYTDAQFADPGGSASLDTSSTANTTAYNNNSDYYGYLYNWCAAMGGQSSACENVEHDQTDFDKSVSICPAGWRLPTGHDDLPGNEFQALADEVGATNDVAGSINLRNNFLAVFAGDYYSVLDGQGTFGNYWSSTVYSAQDAHTLYFRETGVDDGGDYSGKRHGFAVRCVL